MTGVARSNQDKVGTGVITGTHAGTVYVEGKIVSVVSDEVAPHSGHTGGKIAHGSTNVFANNLAVARLNDKDDGDHPITTASGTVFAN